MNKIISSVPVNRTAAIVVGKGTAFNPDKKVETADSDNPLPTFPIPREVKGQIGFVDLTGVRFGRFTVFGYSVVGRGRWVVRCDCGKYSIRKAKAIKNKSNDHDCCDHCRHLVYLKRTEYFRRTGKNKPIIEFL